MKILLLCNKAPFPPNDGSSIAIYNMAKGFEALGVDLDLFSINTKKHFKSDNEVRAGFLQKTSYHSVFLDTNTTFLGALFNLFSNQSYFVSRFFNPLVETRLESMLKENKFDIIQIEGVFMASYIPIIRKYSAAKIVLRAHNIEYCIWKRHIETSNSWLKKAYLKIQTRRLRTFELKMFQSVDAIVPISNADATQISISSKLPIHTAIAGVDVKAYVKIHTSEFEPFSIFHFGSMDWIPNQEAVDWFLKFCWPEIRTEIPQVKFIIGGRNIPKRFKRLSSDQVIIRENVQNAAAIFSKYNIMIVPVLSGSGMRVKIVEGLSYGKAIVSTTLGAEGIEIENNKHISIVDSPLDFSKQVINLLKNEAERIRMERNAREYAIENLDYLSISEKLIYFYKKLID